MDYANRVGAVILFDAAYEAYISEEDVPHSIYECEGARTCAIELRSFSKNAGFTGTRLGYTVVPKDLKSDGVMRIPCGRDGTAQSTTGHRTSYRGPVRRFILKRERKRSPSRVAYYMRNAKTN